MTQLHPSIISIGEVKIGKRNEILPYTILIGPIEIGDDNIIGPHAVIGSPGADTRNPRYNCTTSKIHIGSRNIIREFVSIQKPSYTDLTVIGNDTYIMPNAQIQHDVNLEDGVVVTASAALAGITQILKRSYLGMGCTISQYCVVGQYSIVGTGAPVLKNIKPFSKYIPNKPLKVNLYAIEKYGFSNLKEEITQYVIHGTEPKNNELKKIIEHYKEKLKINQKSEYI